MQADLTGKGRGVGLVHGGEFGRAGSYGDASAATVIADVAGGVCAVDVVVVDDGVDVDVGDRGAYVGDGAVVEEVAAVPIATEVADADVSIAVVDAAIEADVGAPVAGVPAITIAPPAPVARRPESAVIGRYDPDAGNPVVASGSVAPVAGCPEVVVCGRGGLVVVGEGWWRLVGGDVGVVERGFAGGNVGVGLGV